MEKRTNDPPAASTYIRDPMTVYTMDEGIPHRTLRFRNLPPLLTNKWSKPFTDNDVFSEDSDRIHDMVRSGKTYITMDFDEAPNYNTSVNDWRLILNLPPKKVPKSKGMDLYGFGIRRSCTPPTIFGLLFVGSTLGDRADTRAWATANQVFGTGWKKPDLTVPSLKSKLDQMQLSTSKTTKLPPKQTKLNFASTTKHAPTRRAPGLFVKKDFPAHIDRDNNGRGE